MNAASSSSAGRISVRCKAARSTGANTASPPALLNALQGAEVRVTGAKLMSGRLLRVVAETARGADGRLRDFDRRPRTRKKHKI
jgi:hypothetical protein